MYISMPRDFFVPVIYDFKENLNLMDEDNKNMYRESKESANEKYEKSLQEKEATYVKPSSNKTAEKNMVNEKYYEALKDKEATYVKPGSNKSAEENMVNKKCYEALKDKDATYAKPNMYQSIDDEYINSATTKQNTGCNKAETRGAYNVSINRRIYSDLYDECDRGFKR